MTPEGPGADGVLDPGAGESRKAARFSSATFWALSAASFSLRASLSASFTSFNLHHGCRFGFPPLGRPTSTFLFFSSSSLDL